MQHSAHPTSLTPEIAHLKSGEVNLGVSTKVMAISLLYTLANCTSVLKAPRAAPVSRADDAFMHSSLPCIPGPEQHGLTQSLIFISLVRAIQYI